MLQAPELRVCIDGCIDMCTDVCTLYLQVLELKATKRQVDQKQEDVDRAKVRACVCVRACVRVRARAFFYHRTSWRHVSASCSVIAKHSWLM